MIYAVPLLLVCLLTPSIAAPSIVILVRHAEKVSNDQDTPLSSAGKERAELLAAMLKDSGVSTVFTTEFRRTKETAAPLAKSIGVAPVELKGTLTEQRNRILGASGVVLLVGHSNTVPELLSALGAPGAIKIDDADFGRMFIFVPGPAGASKLLSLRYGAR